MKIFIYKVQIRTSPNPVGVFNYYTNHYIGPILEEQKFLQHYKNLHTQGKIQNCKLIEIASFPNIQSCLAFAEDLVNFSENPKLHLMTFDKKNLGGDEHANNEGT